MTAPLPQLDLSQVTPEQFAALAPHLDHAKLEYVVAEMQKITTQNLAAAHQWNLALQVLRSVGLVVQTIAPLA